MRKWRLRLDDFRVRACACACLRAFVLLDRATKAHPSKVREIEYCSVAVKYLETSSGFWSRIHFGLTTIC